MPDEPTLGEIARGQQRIEQAFTDFTKAVNDRFDAFESRVVRTDRLELVTARIEERMRTGEARLENRIAVGEERANERFKANEDDIDKLAKDLDQVRDSKRKEGERRSDRAWTFVLMFCSGAGVATVTAILSGAIK